MPHKVSIADKLAQFSDHWNPRIVASYNGNEVRVAKLEGEFTWHSHAETDELFFVIAGELTIEFRDHAVTLGAGEMCVVPRTTEHRPRASREAHVMMIDREGEPNTGEQPSELTRATLERL